jgi:hypothetical protein
VVLTAIGAETLGVCSTDAGATPSEAGSSQGPDAAADASDERTGD